MWGVDEIGDQTEGKEDENGIDKGFAEVIGPADGVGAVFEALELLITG